MSSQCGSPGKGEQKWEVKGLVGQCALLSCRPVSEDLQQANCPGRVDTSKRITHTNTYTRVYIHTYRNTHYTYTTTHSYLFIKDFQPLDCFKEESHSWTCTAVVGAKIYSATCFRCHTHVLGALRVCIQITIAGPTKWCRSAQHARCLS